MKNMIKIAGVTAVALALTQSIQAVPIQPNSAIGFSGAVTFNTGSAATATAVTSWINPIVTLDSGSFSSIALNTSASFNNLANWNFATGPGANFFLWSVGGFTFDLAVSSVTAQGGTAGVNGFVVVNGSGTVTGNGLDVPTTLSWSFTSQDPKITSSPDTWTFSASANSTVPDGGATVMLLGIALSGAALLRRKFIA